MAKKILTTDEGVPVSDNQNTLTTGQHAPVLLRNIHTIEKQEMTL
jgi:catalase